MSEVKRMDLSPPPMRSSSPYVPRGYSSTVKQEFIPSAIYEAPPLRPVGAPHTTEMLVQIETL